jgi:hypothetical protein
VKSSQQQYQKFHIQLWNLLLLLAGFYWKINPKAVHRISGNATGWISLENTSHCWT